MCNLLNIVNRVKELEETQNTAKKPSSASLERDPLEANLKINTLFMQAVAKAKRNHSKKEIIASILDAYPKCTIQLTALGL
ncbi:MAG: hypothetical protein K1060chlam4_00802 [Candidatus Anoxychlamydiales bacterium]|nr:hypothetical protein [Candidatus Anoxychlamydiales bacterium]